jgi:hypothetical protein
LELLIILLYIPKKTKIKTQILFPIILIEIFKSNHLKMGNSSRD